MDEFKWRLTKRSVVKLRSKEHNGWGYLSQSGKTWKLRGFPNAGNLHTDVPFLALLTAEGHTVENQLDLREVDELTGLSATKTGYQDTEAWDRILSELANQEQKMESQASATDPTSKTQQPIPLTKLRRLYETLGLLSSLNVHLAIATELERNPARVADYLSDSLAHFSGFDNVEEPFIPENENRKKLPQIESCTTVSGTRDLTALVSVPSKEIIWEVDGDPSLKFTYVERELVLARRTGNAKYEDGTSARCGKRLDWLLKNQKDSTPIIAEVKVGNDKSPLYALIQLLMYASELATPRQVLRLKTHYKDSDFWEKDFEAFGEEQSNPVNLYIVLSDYNYRSGIRCQLLDEVNDLSRRLADQPSIGNVIRRIACLEAKLCNEKLTFRCLFSHPQWRSRPA